MTTDNTTHAMPHRQVTGPAVSFDPAALRSWLAEPTGEDSTRADELGIDEFFSRAHGYLLSGLDDLRAALADDDEQNAWRLQPGIEHVGFFRTFDGETDDGALIVVDLAGGLRLASLHQDHRDFASLDTHGTDTAVEALTNLAVEANRIVARYRAKTTAQRQPTPSDPAQERADGRLTDREVCIYGLTETQYRELEAAMGLPRYALGRYKQWSAPDGVYLGSPYDLDAAIGYARRTGLRYSETREVYHAPAAPRPPVDDKPACRRGAPCPDLIAPPPHHSTIWPLPGHHAHKANPGTAAAPCPGLRPTPHANGAIPWTTSTAPPTSPPVLSWRRR